MAQPFDQFDPITARWREADKPVNGLYTFGAPRVGNREFERTFNQDFGARSFRFYVKLCEKNRTAAPF